VTRADVLLTTMEEAYARLRSRVEGLDDEEFFWQPRPETWTIYEDRPGHWTYHYAIPDPDPAPLTTIGWQVVHVALCKVMYHEWAYGSARMTWPELDVPHTASSTLTRLEDGQAMLRKDLQDTPDNELDDPRKTNWGEVWPAWRIFTAMTDHDAFHGGTIGYLRDLYRWRRS